MVYLVKTYEYHYSGVRWLGKIAPCWEVWEVVSQGDVVKLTDV